VSFDDGKPDDVSALDGIIPVSRETGQRLEQFVDLLRKWQSADNLVGRGTLSSVWRRHVADSAQLLKFFPDSRIWLDIGSGAGFPGLVVAILLAETPGSLVHLVESNTRKCAFLRQAIRQTGAPAKVHNGRIEAILTDWSEPVDMISARALAPLDRLISLAEPLFSAGVRGAIHKGQDFAREIEETAKSWVVDLVKHQSLTDERGVILEIRHVARRPHPANGV